MEKTTVKFCGFTNTDDIQYALDCDIDYIGLIFTEKSPRCISINQAEKLCQLCDGKKKIVGVFMDQPKKFVDNIIDNLNLSFLQFHGNEPYDYCNSFNQKYTKTLHINNPAYEFNIINKYHDAYAFLLDTSIGNIKGGTGKTFDWSLINKYKNKQTLVNCWSKISIKENLSFAKCVFCFKSRNNIHSRSNFFPKFL